MIGSYQHSLNQSSLVRQIELHVVSSGSRPRLPVEPAVRSGCAGKVAEIGTAGEAEHRAAPFARDRGDGSDHVVHPLLIGGDKEDAEIVDAEMIVDHPRCDDSQ